MSIKAIQQKAARDILKKHHPGFYRPVDGADGDPEYFSIETASEWTGSQVVVSMTDYLIGMLDRDYKRGDQIVTETEGVYEVHDIVAREGAMLTLRTTKL